MNYLGIYEELMLSRKFNLKSPNTERHHIIPKCMGGDDNADNLVNLTFREHFLAHLLLHRAYPENSDLALAVFLMCRHENMSGLANSKTFEKAKEASKEAISTAVKNYWDTLPEEDMAKWKESNRRRSLEMWSDPEKAKEISSKIKDSLDNPEARELKRLRAKEMWSDPEKAKKVSRAAAQAVTKPEVRSKISESNKLYYKNNPERARISSIRMKEWFKIEGNREKMQSYIGVRWRAPRHKDRQHIWALAARFWELSKWNPDLPKGVRAMGYTRFAKTYLSLESQPTLETILSMFREGWVPMKDENWVEDFIYKKAWQR